jgi:hypothetical protein
MREALSAHPAAPSDPLRNVYTGTFWSSITVIMARPRVMHGYYTLRLMLFDLVSGLCNGHSRPRNVIVSALLIVYIQWRALGHVPSIPVVINHGVAASLHHF